MAISTATIFLSVTIVVLASVVMSLSSYGAGLEESKNNKDSPAYKAALSFIGISGGVIFIAILIVVYKALVSNDGGVGGGSAF